MSTSTARLAHSSIIFYPAKLLHKYTSSSNTCNKETTWTASSQNAYVTAAYHDVQKNVINDR